MSRRSIWRLPFIRIPRCHPLSTRPMCAALFTPCTHHILKLSYLAAAAQIRVGTSMLDVARERGIISIVEAAVPMLFCVAVIKNKRVATGPQCGPCGCTRPPYTSWGRAVFSNPPRSSCYTGPHWSHAASARVYKEPICSCMALGPVLWRLAWPQCHIHAGQEGPQDRNWNTTSP